MIKKLFEFVCTARPYPKTDLPWDMDGNGLFTISDVSAWGDLMWQWVAWLFFVPGDLLFAFVLLYVKPFATFFEITLEIFGGWESGFLSAVFWLFSLLMFGGFLILIADEIADFTQWIRKWVRPVNRAYQRWCCLRDKFTAWIFQPIKRVTQQWAGWKCWGLVAFLIGCSIFLAFTAYKVFAWGTLIFAALFTLFGLVGYWDTWRARKRYAKSQKINYD